MWHPWSQDILQFRHIVDSPRIHIPNSIKVIPAGRRCRLAQLKLVLMVPTLRRCAIPGSSCQRLQLAHCHRARIVQAYTAAPARTSLIPETLEEMETDTELQQHMQRVSAQGQAALTREERMQRQRSLDHMGVPSFAKTCMEQGVPALTRSPATILQINIGLYCNQACSHCHVESSPRRREAMDHATAAKCVELLKSSPSIRTLDITGGAPEMHVEFRYLVHEARALGVEVIDRCNLTVLLEPGQEDLPAFLAANKVRVVASLPCYSADNVDKQRGRGVFERSIEGLRMLNAVGYGQPDSGLFMDLVYNPGGAFLAPDQAKLEVAYKSELSQAYCITFNSLLALNNMPVKRFADWLSREGKMNEYMQLLVNAFNPSAGKSLMCRDTVSVRWDGALFDCDFNQQLALAMMTSAPPSMQQALQGSSASTSRSALQGPIAAEEEDNTSAAEQAAVVGPSGGARRVPLSVFDLTSVDELTGRPIRVDNHCFGCTAGSGSSCQGAVS